MAHVNYVAYGWITPTLAFLLSFLGCLLGLHAAARARMTVPGPGRARWLALSAWSIGSTGIWAMHFVAMIGFAVDGSPVRFDPATTLTSWLTAIVVVGVGVFMVGYGSPTIAKVLVGGFFTGLGVAATHYTGMGAMRVDGVVSYDTALVVASVAIAVVASTAALWWTVHTRSSWAIAGAAALMAVAAGGMHYIGLAAMHVELDPVAGPVAGWPPLDLLLPIFVVVLLSVVALGYALLNSLSIRDRNSLEALQARLGGASARLEDVTAGFRTGRRR